MFLTQFSQIRAHFLPNIIKFTFTSRVIEPESKNFVASQIFWNFFKVLLSASKNSPSFYNLKKQQITVVIKIDWKYSIAPRVGYQDLRLLEAHSWNGSICTIEPSACYFAVVCGACIIHAPQCRSSSLSIFQ